TSSIGIMFYFFFQAEDGIRDLIVTGVQTCALPIYPDAFQDRRSSARARPQRPRRDDESESGQADVAAQDLEQARHRRATPAAGRSEERRVGKECRSRWSQAQ